MKEEARKMKRLLSVNWEDGMLIKASHFIEQESYLEELNRWVIRSCGYFYGLTRPHGLSGPALELRLDHDGQSWIAVLTRCYAFTESGRIIQIDSDFKEGIKTGPIPQDGREPVPLYVQAVAAKKPVGMPGDTDTPTRHPYRGYDYRLIAGKLSDSDPADCLNIGLIVFEEDKPELSPDFIPPTMTIGAHPALAEHCHRLAGLLTLVRQGALNGFHTFVSAGQDKPGKFGLEHKWLQEMLADLSIKIGGRLKAHPDPDLPATPYSLIVFYKEIFGILDAMLETYSDASLTLKKKFADSELFGRFLDGARKFASAAYIHQDIGSSVTTLIRLMNDFVEFINLIKSLAGILPEVGKLFNYRNREYRLQNFTAIVSQPERDGVTIKIEGFGNIVSRDVLIGLSKNLFSGVDYRYIMVKIGINGNDIPGRMDPVYVDADASPQNLILKPMDDLADQSITAINLNLRGNFNPQSLKDIGTDQISAFVY